MMTQRIGILMMMTVFFTAFGAAMPGGDEHDLNWFTIDGGGGYSFGDDFELDSTIGQHDAGPLLAAGDFTLAGGFRAGTGPSDTSEVAALFDFEIIRGSLLGGGLPELQGSDDQRLHTRSGFGTTFIDLHSMHLRLSAMTTLPSPATLDLTIESNIDEPSGLAKVEAYNWTTGQLDVLTQYAIGSTEGVKLVPGLDASRYVSNLGEIEVHVTHLVFVPQFAFVFESFFDQVEITVNE